MENHEENSCSESAVRGDLEKVDPSSFPKGKARGRPEKGRRGEKNERTDRHHLVDKRQKCPPDKMRRPYVENSRRPDGSSRLFSPEGSSRLFSFAIGGVKHQQKLSPETDKNENFKMKEENKDDQNFHSKSSWRNNSSSANAILKSHEKQAPDLKCWKSSTGVGIRTRDKFQEDADVKILTNELEELKPFSSTPGSDKKKKKRRSSDKELKRSESSSKISTYSSERDSKGDNKDKNHTERKSSERSYKTFKHSNKRRDSKGDSKELVSREEKIAESSNKSCRFSSDRRGSNGDKDVIGKERKISESSCKSVNDRRYSYVRMTTVHSKGGRNYDTDALLKYDSNENAETKHAPKHNTSSDNTCSISKYSKDKRNSKDDTKDHGAKQKNPQKADQRLYNPERHTHHPKLFIKDRGDMPKTRYEQPSKRKTPEKNVSSKQKGTTYQQSENGNDTQLKTLTVIDGSANKRNQVNWSRLGEKPLEVPEIVKRYNAREKWHPNKEKVVKTTSMTQSNDRHTHKTGIPWEGDNFGRNVRLSSKENVSNYNTFHCHQNTDHSEAVLGNQMVSGPVKSNQAEITETKVITQIRSLSVDKPLNSVHVQVNQHTCTLGPLNANTSDQMSPVSLEDTFETVENTGKDCLNVVDDCFECHVMKAKMQNTVGNTMNRKKYPVSDENVALASSTNRAHVIVHSHGDNHAKTVCKHHSNKFQDGNTMQGTFLANQIQTTQKPNVGNTDLTSSGKKKETKNCRRALRRSSSEPNICLKNSADSVSHPSSPNSHNYPSKSKLCPSTSAEVVKSYLPPTPPKSYDNGIQDRHDKGDKESISVSHTHILKERNSDVNNNLCGKSDVYKDSRLETGENMMRSTNASAQLAYGETKSQMENDEINDNTNRVVPQKSVSCPQTCMDNYSVSHGQFMPNVESSKSECVRQQCYSDGVTHMTNYPHTPEFVMASRSEGLGFDAQRFSNNHFMPHAQAFVRAFKHHQRFSRPPGFVRGPSQEEFRGPNQEEFYEGNLPPQCYDNHYNNDPTRWNTYPESLPLEHQNNELFNSDRESTNYMSFPSDSSAYRRSYMGHRPMPYNTSSRSLSPQPFPQRGRSVSPGMPSMRPRSQSPECYPEKPPRPASGPPPGYEQWQMAQPFSHGPQRYGSGPRHQGPFIQRPQDWLCGPVTQPGYSKLTPPQNQQQEHRICQPPPPSFSPQEMESTPPANLPSMRRPLQSSQNLMRPPWVGKRAEPPCQAGPTTQSPPCPSGTPNFAAKTDTNAMWDSKQGQNVVKMWLKGGCIPLPNHLKPDSKEAFVMGMEYVKKNLEKYWENAPPSEFLTPETVLPKQPCFRLVTMPQYGNLGSSSQPKVKCVPADVQASNEQGLKFTSEMDSKNSDLKENSNYPNNAELWKTPSKSDHNDESLWKTPSPYKMDQASVMDQPDDSGWITPYKMDVDERKLYNGVQNARITGPAPNEGRSQKVHTHSDSMESVQKQPPVHGSPIRLENMNNRTWNESQFRGKFNSGMGSKFYNYHHDKLTTAVVRKRSENESHVSNESLASRNSDNNQNHNFQYMKTSLVGGCGQNVQCYAETSHDRGSHNPDENAEKRWSLSREDFPPLDDPPEQQTVFHPVKKLRMDSFGSLGTKMEASRPVEQDQSERKNITSAHSAELGSTVDTENQKGKVAIKASQEQPKFRILKRRNTTSYSSKDSLNNSLDSLQANGEEDLDKKTHENDDSFSVDNGEFVSKGETCKGNDSLIRRRAEQIITRRCAEQMISRNSQRSRSTAGTPEATGRKPATMDPSSAPDTPKSRRQQQKPVCGPVLPPDHPIAHKDSLARSKAEEETPDNSTEEVFDYFEMKTVPKPRNRVSLPSTASTGPLESRWGPKSSPQANSPVTSTNFWQYKESTSAHVSPNTSVPQAESDCSDIYPTPPTSFVVKSTRWSTGSINSMSTVPLSVQKFAGRYSGVTRPFIDSHCHIDFLFDRSGFKGSYAKYRQVNEETFVPNYRGCVAVFCDPRRFTPNGGFWKDVLAEDNVWGAIGCHPKCATDFGPRQEAALRVMVRHPKVKAVGEIGLDYSGSFSRHKDVQKRVLVRQCEIALEMKMPIVIHSRDSEHDILEVLEEVLPKNYKIHRHCFTGTWEEAEEWLRRFPNSYIGLTPLVTWKGQDRAYGPRDVAARLPLNKLLLETDAPYFLPRCIYQKDMKFSHPGFAITVAEEVAWLKHCSVDEVLQQVLHNTCNMYDLEL